MEQAWSNSGSQPWPNPVSELRAMYTDPKSPNAAHDLESITTPIWHLILDGNSHEELYDYRTDEHEAHDLASNTPAVTQVLKAQLQRETGATTVPGEAMTAGNAAHRGKKQVGTEPAVDNTPPRNWQRMQNYLKALGYAPR